MHKIDFANLQYQYQLYKEEIDSAIQKVLDNSNYIMGQEVRELEENLNTNHFPAEGKKKQVPTPEFHQKNE